MSQPQVNRIPASSQVAQVIQQLNATLLRKHSLEAEVKALDEQIAAFKNIVTGVELGKQLHAEALAEPQPPPAQIGSVPNPQ